jgi:hypothetical protein
VPSLILSPYLQPHYHYHQQASMLLRMARASVRSSHAAANGAEASAQLHVVQGLLVDVNHQRYHGGWGDTGETRFCEVHFEWGARRARHNAGNSGHGGRGEWWTLRSGVVVRGGRRSGCADVGHCYGQS